MVRFLLNLVKHRQVGGLHFWNVGNVGGSVYRRKPVTITLRGDEYRVLSESTIERPIRDVVILGLALLFVLYLPIGLTYLMLPPKPPAFLPNLELPYASVLRLPEARLIDGSYDNGLANCLHWKRNGYGSGIKESFCVSNFGGWKPWESFK